MVYVADLPPFMQERVTCSIAAAEKYHLPPHYLLAVAERENGRPGQQVRNTNGTYDVGAMQINTAYIRTLSRYGVTQSAVAQPGCYAYYLAAWRIKRHIVYDRKGDIWTKIANYHSYTPK
ncbi:transglycosylase SLT domain-containing protein, partial [Neisseria gonorrhoeae]